MPHPLRTPLRIFVAAYPAPDAALALVRAHANLFHDEQLAVRARRDTPTSQVHVTLHFVGEVAPAELDEVRESVERSVAGLPAFAMAFHELRSLPARGPARLVAASAQSCTTLDEVRRRLVKRLAWNPRAQREVFLPHATLSRFAAPQAEVAIERSIDPVVTTQIASVELVRSILKPGGAEHVLVERFPLT
ncbi:MAG: 2'-5' RNA ligase family protein [Planctomycetota bacterium]|nr:2'-5' RNA ligase family protein [Planctomycetota bacterium]